MTGERTWRTMPFERGALFLSPAAEGLVVLDVLLAWVRREGLRCPGD